MRAAGVDVVLFGAEGGDYLPPGVVAPGDPAPSFPAGAVDGFDLDLDRARLRPDRYSGFVHLRLEEGTERVSVPVDLAVRMGGLWPAAVLLLGLALGQIVKLLEAGMSPQAQSARATRVAVSPRALLLYGAFTASAVDWRARLGLPIKTVTLLVLWWVGIQLLYEADARTLGAGGWSDLWPLFVWGLSADIARRTLGRLPTLVP